MTKRIFNCHACSQPTREIDIEDPKYWRSIVKMDAVRVQGSYSSSLDTGEIRYVVIGGKEYQFLREEIREHWPELERMVKMEDDMP